MEIRVDVVANPAGRSDYVITTSTGYRATMERCDRDACSPHWAGMIAMTPCARPLNDKHMHSSGNGSQSVDAWLKHSATHCHGWHDARVEEFVRSLKATTRPWRPFTPAEAARPASASRWTVERIARELGWTPEDVKAELAKADA